MASMVRNTGASGAGGTGSGRTGLARRTKSIKLVASGLRSARAASTAVSSSSATEDSRAFISSSPTPALRSRTSCTRSGSWASHAVSSSGVR